MSTVAQTPLEPTKVPQAPSAPPGFELHAKRTSDAIWQAYSNSSSIQQFLNEFVAAIGKHFNSPFVLLSWEASSGVINASFAIDSGLATSLGKRCSGLMLDTRYRNTANARPVMDPANGLKLVILTCPIVGATGNSHESICAVSKFEDANVASAQLRELQTLVGIACTLATELGNKPSKPAHAAAATAAVSNDAASAAKAANYQSLTEFAFAITNNLKAKVGSESVSFGMVRKNRVDLIAISGTSQIDRRSLETQLLKQVMEECLDAKETCNLPAANCTEKKGAAVAHLIHRRWQASSDGAAVASIPLRVGDQVAAVLTLRHLPGESFQMEHLEKVRGLVEPLVPGATLLERVDRKLTEHIRRAMLQWLRRTLATDTWLRRVLLGSLLACIAVVSVGEQDYYITIPCTLLPAAERDISVPFESRLAEVYVRVGDAVQAGQALARMDTRQIELEIRKARADAEAASVDAMHGAELGDLQKLAIGKAKVDAAQKLMQKLENNLARADITAPSDGVILSGDLEKRVGEPISRGEPLLVFAPSDQWKVTMDVPEFATDFVQAGQEGVVAALAKPNESMPICVDYLSHSAQVRDGKNIFDSDAKLQTTAPSWLRSGMKGTARINVGRYPIWWVWLHRWVDHFRWRVWTS